MILLNNIERNESKTKEIIYRFAKKTDTKLLIKFMKRHPQTAFCEWQDGEFINAALENQTTIIIISKTDADIIGVIIAGIMGTRATINHLAVDKNYRKQSVGSNLANRSLCEIKRRGVRRVFLFVNDENENAIFFWSNHGFNATIKETTMEKDL